MSATRHTQAEINEATESMLMAVLVSFVDEPDDATFPARDFLVGVGKACGVELELGKRLEIPEEMTIGLLRERTRAARSRLASGESRS